MYVTRFPNKITNKKTTLILGSFESFHNGHFKLVKKAREFNNQIVMMIIENPEDIPGASKEVFQPLDIRLQNLSNVDIDFVVVVKYDTSIAAMDGHKFLEKMIKITNAKKIVSGKDFAMGKGRHLKATDIKDNVIIDILKVNGAKVSTSILKESLQLGNVDLIKKITPFTYINKFKVNAKKEINFDHSIKLHNGLYACFSIVNDIKYWSYLEVPIDEKPKLIIPQLKVVNKAFEAIVEIHKRVKIIVKDSQNRTTEEDIAKVINILQLESFSL
ncbi:hypothetical protein [Candidatus Mycoplasma mahonii]|uniref:hypothetical protein n=1 Tax=Candidatus Mycoplasma mahonii TaxID=3004105 RepID=UPI0026EB011E|nr:hypothetical protein [Candidatus Mycoplasma mahonii]WKX02735.1 hypothetical protein O3I44_01535 [Candidatus Mycoplasma mahonii]